LPIKKLVRVKPRQPMILTDTPNTAFDKVSKDVMGPLPITENGNCYILTIQDLLTKYLIIIPMRTASAISVAQGFVKYFICIYGTSKALLTDQGSHFLNELMRNIAKKFKIKYRGSNANIAYAQLSVHVKSHVCWWN